MRLTMKNKHLKMKIKELTTENPTTQVSGKYELQHELGPQELLTSDDNVPSERIAQWSCSEKEGFSQEP